MGVPHVSLLGFPSRTLLWSALLLRLFGCGTTTRIYSHKLLEKDVKFWEELELQWDHWDLLTVVPFPAEIWYH